MFLKNSTPIAHSSKKQVLFKFKKNVSIVLDKKSTKPLNFVRILTKRRSRRRLDKSKPKNKDKSSKRFPPFCSKGMEFGSHTFNNDPEKPENDNGSGKNWKSISKFILNQDLETFRDTLKQINTDFYDDFEDTTLKAYNLNHLREDDFKKLKNFGLDHQNLNLINKL